ncbi:TIGR03943 family protein [Nocardiopsis sp. NPDC006139]|uniref:TIGR03943 family putative permease subunit n=1 Tax=Nocardiopsis TaxID=2013 RepID=UPI0033A22D4D
MNRIAQGLTLVLLGTSALTATVPTDMYLNWVKPAFQPFLIAAGAVMAVLGVWLVIAELRGEAEEHAHHAHPGDDEAVAEAYGHGGGHGHDHSRAPHVAWLLLLPVLAVFVVAPPALGSYTVQSTASESSAPPPQRERSGQFDDGLEEAAEGEVVPLELRQFVMRAWIDEERAMAGRTVELTGFAVPAEDGEGWYLARLQMACCAADAVVNKVLITDGPVPEADSWWTVRGTWVEPEGELYDVSEHRFAVTEREEVTDPPDPYE